MYKGNLIAIDLAKETFQVCLIDNQGKERINRQMSRTKLIEWLARQAPSAVVFEACGSAHYWCRVVERMGHQGHQISALWVSRFRQGHKTDATDARAIAIAYRQPKVKRVAAKSIEQQGLQGIERIRQHFTDHLTATGNLIRGLLREFGLVVPKGKAALRARIVEILQDENTEMPQPLRKQLMDLWGHYQHADAQLRDSERLRDQLIVDHEACRQLMRLEGVGPVNALNLYLCLGQQGKSFANGREAATCIGLTPKQYSTGGKVVMLGISRVRTNRRLRSTLVQGARSVMKALRRRAPRSAREVWLKALIERRGEGRAAVAYANKTVRLAWAMLHYGEEFRLETGLPST